MDSLRLLWDFVFSIHWFDLMKGAVIPLSIGATLLLILAVSHTSATGVGRKREYRIVCRMGRAFAVVFLGVVFCLDFTLAYRSSFIGFPGSSTPGSITAAYMSVGNYILVYSLAAVLGFVLLALSIQGQGVDPEYENLRERDRKRQLELERRRRR